MRRRLAAVGACLLLVAVSGCGNWSSYQFRNDHRLHFLAPSNRAFVTLPLTLKWSIRKFTIAAPGAMPRSAHSGYFAIFVDTPPISPGNTMRQVADHDYSCLSQPTCPDAQYLHDRQIFTTTDTSLVLKTVQAPAIEQKTELHDVVIVLMDTSGRRIGEAAWYLQFRMHKRKIL